MDYQLEKWLHNSLSLLESLYQGLRLLVHDGLRIPGSTGFVGYHFGSGDWETMLF